MDFWVVVATLFLGQDRLCKPLFVLGTIDAHSLHPVMWVVVSFAAARGSLGGFA
jgi:hypothetical protein